jgi:hypothetical protein
MTHVPTRRLSCSIFCLLLCMNGCNDAKVHTVSSDSAHVEIRAPGPPLKKIPGKAIPKKSSLRRDGPDMAPLKL